MPVKAILYSKAPLFEVTCLISVSGWSLADTPLLIYFPLSSQLSFENVRQNASHPCCTSQDACFQTTETSTG